MLAIDYKMTVVVRKMINLRLKMEGFLKSFGEKIEVTNPVTSPRSGFNKFLSPFG